MGLGHDVTFVDEQSPDELRSILRSSDVYILPVAGGQYDIHRLMAMAEGCVAIVADGHMGDGGEDDRSSLVFEEGHSSGLSAQLSKVLNDRAFARTIAQRAVEYMGKMHSPTAVASELAGIYRLVYGWKHGSGPVVRT